MHTEYRYEVLVGNVSSSTHAFPADILPEAGLLEVKAIAAGRPCVYRMYATTVRGFDRPVNTERYTYTFGDWIAL
jgi:hypothetical protein